ncbi:fructose-bisphosphate aldolase [Suicoccus acidiformans]|uniref:Fructose-bisphosphate aldolase n=1 Tax=Suicoccus acidiformans TaxID=2036206 RepID=A0A347WIR1_9LACT|nr:fructose-6-phosphate aldolase [Suicoccus acidiformans]AXY24968.1 fructose-bisphosphate aldolase [Suicoccus acidiformans]
MKLIIDSANVDKIKEYLEYLPIDGVTTNPSILKAEGKIEFINHMKEIRHIIGIDKSLHVQTISDTAEGMVRDAHDILESIDDQVYVKIPTSKEGLKAIKQLKAESVNITATAIYSTMQGLLATEMGADYLAPYINRMQNLDTDPFLVVNQLARNIEQTNSSTRILGASYKNVSQVIDSLMAGATHVTVGSDVLDKFLDNANIAKAVADFGQDWNTIHERFSIK